MTPYNTNQEIRQRLKSAGIEFFADDDYDGAVSTDESNATITTANDYAGALVDEAICEFVNPTVARGQGNEWLKGRHLDIACHRIATVGGGEEIASLRLAHDEAMAALDRARGGAKIPGLIYTYPANKANTSHRFPVAINPL